jgi:hypothetical protein
MNNIDQEDKLSLTKNEILSNNYRQSNSKIKNDLKAKNENNNDLNYQIQ